jgi:hypothetical protein
MSGTASGARATLLPPRRRWCRTCQQLTTTTSWFCSTAGGRSRQRQTEYHPLPPTDVRSMTLSCNVDSGIPCPALLTLFVGTAGNRRHDGRPRAPDRQHAHTWTADDRRRLFSSTQALERTYNSLEVAWQRQREKEGLCTSADRRVGVARLPSHFGLHSADLIY